MITMKILTKLLIIMILSSCYPQNELLMVKNNYYKVMWCTYDTIWVMNRNQKVITIKNEYHEPMCAGDFVVF